MVQKNIRFMTTGQLMTFCNVCQKMNADITVKDVTGRFEIDAKSIDRGTDDDKNGREDASSDRRRRGTSGRQLF